MSPSNGGGTPLSQSGKRTRSIARIDEEDPESHQPSVAAGKRRDDGQGSRLIRYAAKESSQRKSPHTAYENVDVKGCSRCDHEASMCFAVLPCQRCMRRLYEDLENSNNCRFDSEGEDHEGNNNFICAYCVSQHKSKKECKNVPIRCVEHARKVLYLAHTKQMGPLKVNVKTLSRLMQNRNGIDDSDESDVDCTVSNLSPELSSGVLLCLQGNTEVGGSSSTRVHPSGRTPARYHVPLKPSQLVRKILAPEHEPSVVGEEHNDNKTAEYAEEESLAVDDEPFEIEDEDFEADEDDGLDVEYYAELEEPLHESRVPGKYKLVPLAQSAANRVAAHYTSTKPAPRKVVDSVYHETTIPARRAPMQRAESVLKHRPIGRSTAEDDNHTTARTVRQDDNPPYTRDQYLERLVTKMDSARVKRELASRSYDNAVREVLDYVQSHF